MKVADISNYDYDQDIYNPDGWVQALIEAGVEGFIIGSQNMMKARWQLEHIRTAGSPVVATYAEPNVTTAIQLAEESGAKRVCIVIEPGGIRTLSELRAGIANVRAHLLKPTIYGNRSDILALIGDSLEFEDVPLWFASYGLNDGTKAPVTEVDFGGFTVWAHQYTSTAYIAGKNRDLNYVFEEDDMGMTPEEKARFDRLLKWTVGSDARMDEMEKLDLLGIEARLTRDESNDGPIGKRLAVLEEQRAAETQFTGNELADGDLVRLSRVKEGQS